MTLGDMKVRRIHTPGGSHIEPGLDPDWSPLTKLRWHAAVAMLDAPIKIIVRHGLSSTNGIPRDEFCVNVGRTGFGSAEYDWAWTIITGLGVGAEEASRRAQEPTPIFERMVVRHRLAA